MLFSSFPFICGFPIAALLYAFLRRRANRYVSQGFLLLLSMGFYCYGGLRYLPLLLGSIAANWAFGRLAGDSRLPQTVRKRWLVAGIISNVLFLSLFKYLNLCLDSLRPVFGFTFGLPDWALPLGASFFTLTQIMYLVDTYEGLIPPNGWFDHASFVSFFPYVIAGPLTRARPMVQQFHRQAHSPPTAEEVSRGFALFVIGLAKKTIFADSLVRLADTAFVLPKTTSTLETWFSVLAYWMQIYFDFSGYSDMAVGAARMLGFSIPFNFDAPYKSKSIIEFWQRWHISLSQFITTYLYTPILRGFKGRATVAKAAVAAIVAMTISGLWHGPAWTFVAWGLCHGVALAVNQYSRKKWKLRFSPGLSWALTCAFVIFAGILFRATSLENALQVLSRLVPHGSFRVVTDLSFSVANPEALSYLLPSVLAFPIALIGPSSQNVVDQLQPTLRTSLAYASLAFISLVFLNSIVAKSFVYFGF